MEIYVVRHGETHANVAEIGASEDVELTERGVQQAEKAAAKLKGIPLTKIYSSPVLRARRTAEIINQFHRLPLTIDDRLKEIYLPSWEGKHLHEYTRERAKHPEGWLHYRRENDESFFMCFSRVKGFCQKEIFPHQKEKESVLMSVSQSDTTQTCCSSNMLIVCHTDVVRALTAILLEQEPDFGRRFHIGNASIAHFIYHENPYHKGFRLAFD